jgi:hypothetical protein
MKFKVQPVRLTWEKDFQGKIFGHLTPIEMAGSNKNGETLVRCKCNKCGTIFETRGTELRNGKRRSCGCTKNNGFRRVASLSTSLYSTDKGSAVEPFKMPDFLEYKNLPMRPPGR